MTYLIELVISLLSLWAAAIHFYVLPDHLAEMAAHGVFMAVAGTLQLVSGALFSVLHRVPRWGLILTLVGNLTIAALAVLAYTLGLPGSGGPEEVTSLVVEATAAELGIVVLTAILLWLRRSRK